MPSATLTVYDVPPSLNQVGSRGHWRRFHGLKKAWQNDVGLLLMAERVPRGLERVEATARLVFPQARRRDEGNFRALLEKVVGDALVAGAFLPDDTPELYRFGAVTFDVEPGVRKRTEITITYEEARHGEHRT